MAEFYVLEQMESAGGGPGRGPRHTVSSQRLLELKFLLQSQNHSSVKQICLPGEQQPVLLIAWWFVFHKKHTVTHCIMMSGSKMDNTCDCGPIRL